MRRKRCSQTRERLSGYLDGELPEPAARQLAAEDAPDEFTDGVYFIRLGPLESREAVARREPSGERATLEP